MEEYKDIELTQTIPELDEEQKLILFSMSKEELNQKFETEHENNKINPNGNWFYKISEKGILKYKLMVLSEKMKGVTDEKEIDKYKEEIGRLVEEYQRKN